MPGLLRVFFVAEWGVCSIVCPVFVPCTKCLCHLAADVPGVPLIYHVQKWGKFGSLLVIAVYSAINGNETHTHFRKPHFCIQTHFKIVTTKPGKVFYHHTIYVARLNVGNHTLKGWAVEIGSAIPIVDIFIYHDKPILVCIPA